MKLLKIMQDSKGFLYCAEWLIIGAIKICIKKIIC